MPQLKCDEWPDDGEPTTTEQEVPVARASASAGKMGNCGPDDWLTVRSSATRIMTNNRDILEHVAVRVPCTSCHEGYGVSLRQITAAQELLHDVDRMWDEGCPNYCREPVCDIVVYASLVDEGTARDTAHAITDAVTRLAQAGADVELMCSAG